MRNAVALGVLALALAGCPKRQTVPVDAALPRPLAFKLKRHPSGENYELSQDRGKVVILEVWATWCEPCKELLPQVDALARELGDGVRVYGVNIDADVRKVDEFIRSAGLTMPVLLDSDASVSDAQLRVQMMPATFIVDKAGQLRHVHQGNAASNLSQLRQEAEALLREGG